MIKQETYSTLGVELASSPESGYSCRRGYGGQLGEVEGQE